MVVLFRPNFVIIHVRFSEVSVFTQANYKISLQFTVTNNIKHGCSRKAFKWKLLLKYFFKIIKTYIFLNSTTVYIPDYDVTHQIPSRHIYFRPILLFKKFSGLMYRLCIIQSYHKKWERKAATWSCSTFRSDRINFSSKLSWYCFLEARRGYAVEYHLTF